jgi:hypothetical protein
MSAVDPYYSATADIHPDNLARNRASEAHREALFDAAALRFERMYGQMLANGELRQAEIMKHAVEQWLDHKNVTWMGQLMLLRRFPVTISEFMESEDFMGELTNTWPSLNAQLKEMNPDVFVGETPIYECLLGGATGTGKTFLSDKSQAYQLYLLTCFDQPQALWNKSRSTRIVLMFMSVSQTVCKRVIYEPFRNDFLAMPYSKRFIRYDKYKQSSLVLSGNIEVVPALAALNSMVGQAVIGAILDEVNFMARVENSKQVSGSRGLGGTYDQAEQVYFNITRRRSSRFPSKRGVSIGNICVISSTRYKGDFLDKRIDEMEELTRAKDTALSQHIATFRRKRYEVVPEEDYSGKKFRILVGSENWPTRIIGDDEVAGTDFPENGVIEWVPIEHKREFIQDPENALRDIVGIATDTISAFIKQRHKIVDAIERGSRNMLQPLLDKDVWDLQTDGFPVWNRAAVRALANDPRNKDKVLWAHLDLSISGDTTGGAVIRFDGWMNVTDPENEEIVHVRPKFSVIAAFGIKPSGNEEIDPAMVRDFVMQLGTTFGLALREVTYDGYQSHESVKTLHKAGMRSRVISMDRSTIPYLDLRSALYEDRIDIVPPSDVLWHELSTLEYIADKDKVDHPPKGSKDISDCVAGALQAAITSRVLRVGGGQVSNEGEYAKTNMPRPTRMRVAPGTFKKKS